MAEQIELNEWLKAQGMEAVLTRTAEEWKNAFFVVASHLLETRGSVTSEEVVAHVGYPPGHPSAIGASMNGWAKQLKLSVSYEKSTRPSSHAAIIGRWSRKAI